MLLKRLTKDSWLFKQALAHRGFHNEQLPENSIGAFYNAINREYAIELDVHIISDGHIIVFHDSDVKRMTGMEQKTANLTLEDIGTLKLANTDYHIPLLDEVLEMVDGKVPLLIELKNSHKVGLLEEALVQRLARYNGEFMLQSFNPLRVKWLKKHTPSIIRGQISGLYENSQLKSYQKFILKYMFFNFLSKPDFINYQIEGLKSWRVRLLQRRGMPVISWTAGDKDQYALALSLCDNAVFEGFEL
jgi:glycerophosphoryl diester phosphodiesterase